MHRPAALLARLKTPLWIPGGLLALMWLLEMLDSWVLRPVFGMTLDAYGIVPRTLPGLRGIVFAPFLHTGFGHLLGNSLPFLALAGLIQLRRRRDLLPVSLIVAAVSGGGTWAFGASAVHIGASGVIFGYLGFLLLAGYFDRRPGSMALSLVVGVGYGGLLWGVLPQPSGISWEGHLFGFLGGVLAARLLAADGTLLRKQGAYS